MVLLDTVFRIPLFAYIGVVFGAFFMIAALRSPVFRQPRLMKYHMKIGKFTILFGFIHMFFALSALFFGVSPKGIYPGSNK